MNVVTIEVASTADPEEGKKKATIRTADGGKFYCWPNQKGWFQPGRTYKVEFEESEFRGHTIRNVTRVKPAPNAMAPIEQERSSRPAPSSDASPTDREFMFVTRLLQSSVQTGCIVGKGEDDYVRHAMMLRAVYRRVFG